MKVYTFKQFRFSADLYSFFTTRDSTGGEIRNYLKKRSIKLFASSNTVGRLAFQMKATEGDVQAGYRLHKLTDASGNEIIPNAVWEVQDIEPVLDMWGVKQGYKGKIFWVGVDS